MVHYTRIEKTADGPRQTQGLILDRVKRSEGRKESGTFISLNCAIFIFFGELKAQEILKAKFSPNQLTNNFTFHSTVNTEIPSVKFKSSASDCT